MNDKPFITSHWYMVANVFNHAVELQTKVACYVERAQIVFKGNTTVFFLISFQRVEHNISESIDKPGLQADIRRMILQGLPVMLHQENSILMGQ